MKSIKQHIFEKLKVSTTTTSLSFDFQSILNCKRESEFNKKVTELKEYLNNFYAPLDCKLVDSHYYRLDSKYANSGPFVCANDIHKIIHIGMYDTDMYKIYYFNRNVLAERCQAWRGVSDGEGFDSMILSDDDIKDGSCMFEMPDELIASYETLVKQNS